MNLLPQSLQKPFHGILFDLDGTIIDSEDIHYAAFKQALQEFGYDLEALGDSVTYGGSFRTMFTDIAQRFRLSDNVFEELYQRKVDITLEWPSSSAELIDGIVSFLELMKERDVPMGIVTNSEAAYVDHVLSDFDLHQYFDHIVHAEHVVNPKPAPDAYQYGRELLQLSPDRILAFENTDGGIAAAKGAGLAVVAIRETDRYGISTYANADLTIDHFGDPSIDDLVWYGRNRN